LLCIVASTAALAQDAEKALKQFEGKVLVLRHPLQSNSQQYDSAGKVLTGAPEGPWTVYGGVLIDKMKLKPDALHIEGRRVLFLFLNGQFTAMDFEVLKDRRGPPPFPAEVKLDLRLDHIDDAAGVGTALNRVFAMNTADLMDSIPDLWRECLRDHLVYDPSAQRAGEFSWHEPQPKQFGVQPSMAGLAVRTEADENIKTVYRVGLEVKPPRALSAGEPEFSQVARYEKFQGIVVVSLVVARDGSVHHIRLVRPRGLGLDEQAEVRLKTWRFSPATLKGEPVSVEMNVEFSFNLY
jgi:TonB family protein